MLKLAHWDLSDDLSKLLEEDAVAQAHCGEIVGIDFDPFLLTQDPAEKYEVGAIGQNGRHYMAKVYRFEGRGAQSNAGCDRRNCPRVRWTLVLCEFLQRGDQQGLANDSEIAFTEMLGAEITVAKGIPERLAPVSPAARTFARFSPQCDSRRPLGPKAKFAQSLQWRKGVK